MFEYFNKYEKGCKVIIDSWSGGYTRFKENQEIFIRIKKICVMMMICKNEYLW
jgi:hypothetical protein